MGEILDDQLDEKDRFKRKDKFTFGYSIIMLIGGIFFLKYITISGSNARIDQLVVASFIIQVLFVFICVVVSYIYLLLVKRKNILTKNFLIKNVERGFVVWCIFVTIVLIDKLLA